MEPNFIHPTAIISPSVVLGEGNYIGPYCFITGDTEIGSFNRFEAFVSIGTRPEHRTSMQSNAPDKGVFIGDHNVFREFVTVNGGVEMPTNIESHCYFLRGSHVGHDATIHDWAAIHCNVVIGGHATVGPYAYLGLASVMNPWTTLPALSLLGSNSLITTAYPAKMLMKHVGNPAKPTTINKEGIDRHNLENHEVAELIRQWGTKC